MSRNHFIDDVLDLCDEQGFKHERLMAGTGIKVYPKNVTKPAVVMYYHMGGREPENKTALLRRIGLRFPIDDERDRRKLKSGKIAMVESTKSNGYVNGASVTSVAKTESNLSKFLKERQTQDPPNAFAAVRVKYTKTLTCIDQLSTALLELGESLDKAETEQKQFLALRDLLRQVAL